MGSVVAHDMGSERWALITGASDGIGRACAEVMAADGWSLVLVARDRARLDTVAADAGSTTSPIRIIPADLSDRQACDRLIEETSGLPFSAAILAAGFGTSGPFLETPIEDELGMIDVNCRAVAHLAHGLGRQMAARGHGTMALFSSLVAFQGVARSANYAATKAYVQTLAEGLAAEWKPRGVAVLSVAPGPVRSGFAARAGMTLAATDDPGTVARAIVKALGRSTTIRPGPLSKLLGWSLAITPRSGRTAIMGRVMAGMTGA